MSKDISEIKVLIGNVDTKFEEVVRPAVSQTYKNKDEIIRIKSFQKIIKWVGSTTAAIVAIAVGKSLFNIFSKHPH